MGHRRDAQGRLIADSALFPPFVRDRAPFAPRGFNAREVGLRALPVLQPCYVSQPLNLLDRREAYRQAVLVVERGVARVPWCEECTYSRRNLRSIITFDGCYTVGAGPCAECLRHSGYRCLFLGGIAGGPPGGCSNKCFVR